MDLDFDVDLDEVAAQVSEVLGLTNQSVSKQTRRRHRLCPINAENSNREDREDRKEADDTATRHEFGRYLRALCGLRGSFCFCALCLPTNELITNGAPLITSTSKSRSRFMSRSKIPAFCSPLFLQKVCGIRRDAGAPGREVSEEDAVNIKGKTSVSLCVLCGDILF